VLARLTLIAPAVCFAAGSPRRRGFSYEDRSRIRAVVGPFPRKRAAKERFQVKAASVQLQRQGASAKSLRSFAKLRR